MPASMVKALHKAETDALCVCIAVRKASRRLTSAYDEALEPSGINLAQFSLLRNIRRDQPASLTRLGEAMELDRSTLGRNVRVLEREGLVKASAGRDQREAAVELTDAGTATLDLATPLWHDVQTRIYGKLGQARAAQLAELLAAL